MEKIVFLDRSAIAPHIAFRAPDIAHTWTEYEQTDADQVVERLAGATIAINSKVRLSAETLSRLPDLRLIAAPATGTDPIDKDYCHTHGIAVANVRGYSIEAVPEHTFALMLALRRSILAYHTDVANGVWQAIDRFCFFSHPIVDLAGARLGIMGEGLLGQRVAEIAKTFGMKPVFAAHKGRTGLGPLYTPWDEVLETSDIITVHTPLMPETRNMIALPEFRKMKRRPLLINTARGGLVNEADLETALDEGLISGAGFDVSVDEPPRAGGPLMRISKRSNVILTPHVAWASDKAMQICADQTIDNIENFVNGRPFNQVSGAF